LVTQDLRVKYGDSVFLERGKQVLSPLPPPGHPSQTRTSSRYRFDRVTMVRAFLALIATSRLHCDPGVARAALDTLGASRCRGLPTRLDLVRPGFFDVRDGVRAPAYAASSTTHTREGADDVAVIVCCVIPRVRGRIETSRPVVPTRTTTTSSRHLTGSSLPRARARMFPCRRAGNWRPPGRARPDSRSRLCTQLPWSHTHHTDAMKRGEYARVPARDAARALVAWKP
jgi:hypothetical protein